MLPARPQRASRHWESPCWSALAPCPTRQLPCVHYRQTVGSTALFSFHAPVSHCCRGATDPPRKVPVAASSSSSWSRRRRWSSYAPSQEPWPRTLPARVRHAAHRPCPLLCQEPVTHMHLPSPCRRPAPRCGVRVQRAAAGWRGRAARLLPQGRGAPYLSSKRRRRRRKRVLRAPACAGRGRR